MTLVLRDLAVPLAHFTLELSLELRARTTAFYGPSGAGKTSLLEVIAGLRAPQRGAVTIGEHVVVDVERGIFVPPRLRRVGYVPQDDALFPHMSVRRNVFYGGGTDDHVLDVLEIRHLLDRGVRKLSGGERKRVALARALLRDPEILLLDEPLAGVDLALRTRVLEYLVRVRDELRVPIVYVTHQREEVDILCDEVVIVNEGGARCEPSSSPATADRKS